jgi:hypothetical protein
VCFTLSPCEALSGFLQKILNFLVGNIHPFVKNAVYLNYQSL